MPNDLVEPQLKARAVNNYARWDSDIANAITSAWYAEQHRHPDYFVALTKIAAAFEIIVPVSDLVNTQQWRVEEYNALEVITREGD